MANGDGVKKIKLADAFLVIQDVFDPLLEDCCCEGDTKRDWLIRLYDTLASGLKEKAEWE